MPELHWLLAYLALGLFVGYFSGLLGIGGGLILVPVLLFMFDAQHFPPQLTLHLALGTAMATIIFTSISSARQHHKHQAVNWSIVRRITPGLLLGTALGALIVGLVPTRYLTLFFALFVYLVATQMVLGLKPTSTRATLSRSELTLAGAFIGCLSSLVSIGGGVLSTPYLLWHKLNLRHAIATSAALGFPIAIGGTIGYVVNGYRADELPAYSLGYVYAPALLWLVIGTMITAPIGARATHSLPVDILRKLFALVLFALATKMLWKILLGNVST